MLYTTQCSIQYTAVHYKVQHAAHYKVQHAVQLTVQHTVHYKVQHTAQYKVQHTVHYKVQHTVHYKVRHTAQYIADRISIKVNSTVLTHVVVVPSTRHPQQQLQHSCVHPFPQYATLHSAV